MSYIFFCKNCGKRHEGTDTRYLYGKFCNPSCERAYDWKMRNPKTTHSNPSSEGAKIFGWIVIAAIIGVIAVIGYDFYDFTQSRYMFRH